MKFEQASAAVVDYLKQAVPMGYWAVSRYDGASQVFLTVRDDVYGLGVGMAVPWEHTMCQYSTTGEAPNIAPDRMLVPHYAGAAGAEGLKIGTYIGFPIRVADGSLFGSLCGIDPAVSPPELLRQRPLVDLLSGLLGTVLDAELARADHARQLEQAEALAESDPLTGLVNRRGWERFTAMEEERYRRFGDPGSVIVIDLDGLKAVNDTSGHAAGDLYLRRAAAALRDCVRRSDMVARLGGDEFGVLVARTTAEQTVALVERIRACLEGREIPASVGHAPYTFVAGFPGAFDAADAAMYEDKRRRRGTAELLVTR